MRERNMDVDVLDAAAFSKDYHTALPKGFRGRHRDPMASFNDERRKMRAGQLNESKQYGCIIDMLNQPMQQSLPAAIQLQFIDTHAAHLIRHIKGYKDKPDICAVESHHLSSLEKTDAGHCHRVLWHKTRSVSEVKPPTNDSKKGRQVLTYAASHNLARPDRPGCLTISVSPRGYQITWSDPSGGHISETIAWDNRKGEQLLSFVCSLYIPPALCDAMDPTTSRSPRWNIDFKGKLYKECRISFVGEAHSRKTMIFRHEDNGYDILEAHQYAVMKKQVMHRDMSHRNILVNPFGLPDTNPEGPIFVNTILDSRNKGAQPTALICDLDNGCPKELGHVKDSVKELNNAWEILSGPVRLGLLTWPQQQWERALHPRLKSLMEPEYGFLDPPPADDHLHEAFQRLLLNQIHDLKEDIELNVEELRSLPELQRYETRGTTTPFGASIGQRIFVELIAEIQSEPRRRRNRRNGDEGKEEMERVGSLH
ncbi:uncharacterized protein BT62DRAFT_995335 [Guyanagaster necrorhizus]|uniref:Uncharacterized protein n=1 Tax=Guyanagaster necrorhizus TaxID=856835 RepID=A0A9P8AQR6_9AGAR|nr:uncharacterized protein BT62DRAFT_995335 [Guyanagaster necrorhizus MCA 3950]KAG7444290.1 hypothetical protein BT62DRAFT_995335 [Guyanagaster necrorhizus MCA 3950]